MCVWSLLCSAALLADDNMAANITEEGGSARDSAREPLAVDNTVADTSAGRAPADGAAADAAVEAVALPQAENVNLREELKKPLHQALPATAEDSESKGTTPTEEAAPAEQNNVESAKPLRLLGAEVLPGTATRLAWAAKDSLAGISVPTPVLVVHGKNPGPVVCLTAAVHGDELNGIEVVRHVMYDLAPEKLNGTVIGVPIVNLQGFRRASRYLLDRRDLNRYFPGQEGGSSAARIAHSFFNQVIRHCTVLVDMHTGSFRRTNLPQLRADLKRPEVAELTRNLGAVVVLQSQGAKGSLRRAATEAGIPAVTVEAGEPLHVGEDAVKQGVRSIETLLHKMDMYAQRGLWARKTEPVYYRSRWVRAANGGILMSSIQLGERVKKGQVLGTVTDPITNVARSIKAPMDAQVIGMALNQVMLPGFAAYHLGYQASVKEAAAQDAGPDEASGDDPIEDDEPSAN